MAEFIINEEVKNKVLNGLLLERSRLLRLHEENEQRINSLLNLPELSAQSKRRMFQNQQPESNDDKKS